MPRSRVPPRKGRPYANRDVLEGHRLLVPRTFFLVLGFVLLILTLLAIVPSWFLFKKAVAFMSGYVAPAFAVPILMLVFAVTRNVAKYVDPRDGTTYLLVPAGADMALMGLSIASAILCIAAGINLIIALADCPNRTVQSFCEYVFGSTDACSPVSNWSPAYRLPNFATQTIWDQICLDDYALTIAFVVLLAVILVGLLIVAVFMGTVRTGTVQTLRRAALLDQGRPGAPGPPVQGALSLMRRNVVPLVVAARAVVDEGLESTPTLGLDEA